MRLSMDLLQGDEMRRLSHISGSGVMEAMLWKELGALGGRGDNGLGPGLLVDCEQEGLDHA